MKFLYKIRKHLFILLLAAAYLAAAPGVYARFFVKLGKPTDLNLDPPTASPLIRFGVDSNEEAIVSGQRIYQISGWAFLENAPDQTRFKKYLVLNSSSRVYYYPYEETVRWDIDNYFQDLGLKLLNSGFWAMIAPETVQPGRYNIGFLFINNADGEAYYSLSDRYIIRTPNTVVVATGELPGGSEIRINSAADISLTYGAGVQAGPFDFREDKAIQIWLEDGVSEVTLGGREYGRLAGWAFLEGGDLQSGYNRWLALKSDQDTFYYPVKSIERPDVPKTFPELKSRFTGFSVDVLKESLPSGTYHVSFLFESRTNSPDYVTETRWVVTRTPTEFMLGMK